MMNLKKLPLFVRVLSCLLNSCFYYTFCCPWVKTYLDKLKSRYYKKVDLSRFIGWNEKLRYRFLKSNNLAQLFESF